MSKLSPELLRKILRYDPETGELFWLNRTPDMFQDQRYGAHRKCAAWKSKFAGKEAFTAYKNGYKHGAVFNKTYKAHRVIWAIVYDEWPSSQIDHINGIRDDNRITNLRAVSHAENARNQKRRTDNTTGVCGVGFYKATGKWNAQIHANGKSIHLGYFNSFDDAVIARKEAEMKHGYHENHGRLK